MLPTLSLRRPVDRFSGPLTAFESETQDVIRQTTPYSEHAIVHVVAGMIVLALVLMCVVKLDRVVTSEITVNGQPVGSSGQIVPTNGSLFISPLDRSIVTGIKVHVGDVVKKGQVLATLDPTFANADYVNLAKQVSADQALVQRLQAEQASRPFTARPNNTDQTLQAAIWNQRQTQYNQSIANFDEQINSNVSLLQKSKDDAKHDASLLTLDIKLLDMQKDLAHKGWGSDALLIQAENNVVTQQKQLAEDKNTIDETTHNIASLQAQKADYIGTWRADIGTQLNAAQSTYNNDYDNLVKDTKSKDLTTVNAPQDAVVLAIANASVGSIFDVSTSTQPLFTLNPLNGPLEADLGVSTQDVGFIRVGDSVNLKFDAFEYTRFGTAEGVVKSISEGSFTTNAAGQTVDPYFKVRVKITKLNLRDVPKDMRFIPGMTLTGDILVGGRTIMDYLVEGALRSSSEAMREP